MQLGKAVIVPFQASDGGYVRADDGGYQVLLNYRGTQQQFQTFSFTDLLHNRIPQEKVRDRPYTAEAFFSKMPPSLQSNEAVVQSTTGQ
uniref:hypothetical protein n=1 Tax=Hassallia byssoidea TaxID=482630 RepID=UPI0007C78B99|nr:hypothetical protein [Hassalia byssoidea]